MSIIANPWYQVITGLVMFLSSYYIMRDEPHDTRLLLSANSVLLGPILWWVFAPAAVYIHWKGRRAHRG